ncbi:hypothetical protein EVA_18284 [gut metagenome]|uniref:Uncharacterized protein n=1 Tax=gut metagenome TaxID=749906 RepID=J9G240_9ZZZZ
MAPKPFIVRNNRQPSATFRLFSALILLLLANIEPRRLFRLLDGPPAALLFVGFFISSKRP